jgi:3-phosphoshikimate 1-carboxyvinyltransferase
VVIEVSGELISKPYIEITLNLLARFGIAVQREGWQRFTIPAGSRYRTPGRHPCRGRRLVGQSTSSRWARLRQPGLRRVRILGVGADSIQGDIRFVDAARPWAPTSTAARTGCRCRAAPGPCAGHRPGLQPHSRRRHDAGRDGAVRRRHDHAAQHRQLARQGNRPHRRHGLPSCASSGATVEEGADFIA